MTYIWTPGSHWSWCSLKWDAEVYMKHNTHELLCAIAFVRYLLCNIVCVISCVRYPVCDIFCAISCVQYLLCVIFCAISCVRYLLCDIFYAIAFVQYLLGNIFCVKYVTGSALNSWQTSWLSTLQGYILLCLDLHTCSPSKPGYPLGPMGPSCPGRLFWSGTHKRQMHHTTARIAPKTKTY